jgi:16S rRNA (guanine966-N2)-methyltransferase
LRIISGKYRGKQLFPGKKFTARPTTDFAKESLFNIIANSFEFESLRVLDLFAGTGSISFEFASRGCLSVDAVELHHAHFAFIHRTARDLDFDQMKVFRMDAFTWLRKTSQKYDIIFADPPYDMVGIEKIPEIIFNRELLSENGWFILEHSQHNDFSEYKNFSQTRKYGSVNFSIFEKV